MYLPLDLEQLSLAHIEALREAEVQEGTTVDFKVEIAFKGDEQKKFITDIASLANTLGGELLYGVSEGRSQSGAKQGTINEIRGIEYEGGFEALQLALRNCLRDNVVPHIPSIQFGKIDVAPGRFVFVIRVPRSHVGPHTHKDWCRFHIRTGNQNSPADMTQIRSLFWENASLPERIRNLVSSRLEGINRAQPVQLWIEQRWVLHIIPIQSLDPSFNIEIADLAREYLSPVGAGSKSHYPNIDGLVSIGTYQDRVQSFVLACRSGIIETASCGYFAYSNQPPTISDGVLATDTVAFVHRGLQYLADRGAAGPYFVTGTLVNVAGYTLVRGSSGDATHLIDRPVVSLPVIELGSSESLEETAAALKPLFRTIANAGGYYA